MIKRLLFSIWRLPWPFPIRWLLLRLTNNKFLVGVIGIVLNDEGQVLVLEHTYRRPYAWGLPSGWLKMGEEPAGALVREIQEETGLDVIVERPLLVRRGLYSPDLDLIFLCRFTAGSFRPSAEVSAAEFYLPGALPEGIMPSQRELILRLCATLTLGRFLLESFS